MKSYKYKFLKGFISYQESLHFDLMESLSIWKDILLSSIGAELIDIFDEFKLPDEFRGNLDVDFLNKSIEFVNAISSIGLKKSEIQKTDDYETFVDRPCKFMMIYDSNSNEIENPEYIIFQQWDEGSKKWEEAKLYRIKDDINKFYNKLTSKTIEIVDDGNNYIYVTNNGNDWELQNRESETDIYKKNLRKEDLKKITDSKKIEIKVI